LWENRIKLHMFYAFYTRMAGCGYCLMCWNNMPHRAVGNTDVLTATEPFT
jgi:hypothetical protein